jgi:hypothetical protein
LDKFKKKFGGLGDLAEIGAAASASGPPTGENLVCLVCNLQRE